MDDRPPARHPENLPVRTVPASASRLLPRARSTTLIDVALDELDRIGDRIAALAGLR